MKRIYFNRYKGEKLPEGAKLVTRPSRWGNPFKVSEYGRAEALRLYEKWLLDKMKDNPDYLKPIEGKDLACSCLPGEPCHGDTLIKYLRR